MSKWISKNFNSSSVKTRQYKKNLEKNWFIFETFLNSNNWNFEGKVFQRNSDFKISGLAISEKNDVKTLVLETNCFHIRTRQLIFSHLIAYLKKWLAAKILLAQKVNWRLYENVISRNLYIKQFSELISVFQTTDSYDAKYSYQN